MYDIFCAPGPVRFRTPFVTHPENIRSIIRVDKAKIEINFDKITKAQSKLHS